MKTVLRSSVSLCERCKHRDWHKESDLRWETCSAFERM